MSQFLKPLSPEEAVRMKQDNPGALYLGGGSWINNGARKEKAKALISLEGLNLKTCEKKGDAYVLGAGLTFQELADREDCYPPLREALLFMTSRNLRNQATLGGDLAVGAEQSCLLPLMLALDAELELGEGKSLSMEDYMVRYPEEGQGPLIFNVRFSPGRGRAAVRQIKKSSGGLTVLSAAVWLEQDGAVLKDARVFVGGTAEGILRLKELEEALKAGSLKSDEELEKAAAKEVRMENDLKGSKEYKSYVCGVAVCDCVRSCKEALK